MQDEAEQVAVCKDAMRRCRMKLHMGHWQGLDAPCGSNVLERTEGDALEAEQTPWVLPRRSRLTGQFWQGILFSELRPDRMFPELIWSEFLWPW